MARLQTLKPQVRTIPGRIQMAATLSTQRRKAAAKEHGSADKRWTGEKLQRWRRRILAAEPLCRHCAAAGRIKAADEVDHIVPLENGGTYDDSNAQPLCKDCHQVKTAKDRGYTQRPQIGTDGWPIA